MYEAQPRLGDLVTLSIWKNTSGSSINHMPIISKEAAKQNPEVAKMRTGFSKFLAQTHKGSIAEWSEALEVMFEFLSNQYSKVVQDHKEYLYTAFLSDRLFETQELEDFRGRSKDAMKVDSIFYPSIKNSLKKFNLAVHPNVFDEKFQLYKIQEFEIVGEEKCKLITECTSFDHVGKTIQW